MPFTAFSSGRERRRRRWLGASLVLVGAVSGFAAGPRIEIAWPTANRAYAEGRPLGEFVQPTVSGEIISGLYGCVRSQGTQFHEALDLKPLQRDRRGEATDEIFAVLPGIVRHLSPRAGDSSYGRYIVLEHPEQTPAVYTLYAHLARISRDLEVGSPVRQGQVIAVMGRSAGGYTIPKDRAHVHFEIGVRLAEDFQAWYDWKKFGSRNEHGVWNGMNLVGIDPLEFYSLFRDRRVDNFADYFRQLPAVLTFRIRTDQVPDFIRRYPVLRTIPPPEEGTAGWEVTCNAFGVPFRWTPLPASELSDYKADEVRIVASDDAALRACRCKDLAKRVRGSLRPDRDLETLIQLLFRVR